MKRIYTPKEQGSKIPELINTLENRNKILHFIMILFLIFTSLTAMVYFYPLTVFDLKFSQQIQEYQQSIFIDFMKFVSWFGGTIKVVSLTFGTALLLFIYRFKKEAFFVGCTVLVSVLNYGFKLLIERPRPSNNLVIVVQDAEHSSFPSGHTSFYVVYFGFLIFLMVYKRKPNKIMRIIGVLICVFLIATIPLSRIYLGVHWMTDVIGGFLLGLIILLILIYFYLSSNFTISRKKKEAN